MQGLNSLEQYIEKNNPTSGVPHNFFSQSDLKVKRFNTYTYFENGQFHCLFNIIYDSLVSRYIHEWNFRALSVFKLEI